MTPADYQRARRTLLRRDPVLASLIRRHGPCGLAAAQRADHFSALVRAITGQQLSTKAATTIYGRMVTLMHGGVPTIRGFAGVTDDELRAAGMSRQKVVYLRDLCEKVSTGVLHLTALDGLPDEDVIRARHGQGHRPLVGGHVSDLPAAPARRSACWRSRDRDGGAAGVRAADQAEAGPAAQDWGSLATLPVRGLLVSLAKSRQRAGSSPCSSLSSEQSSKVGLIPSPLARRGPSHL